MLSYGSSWAAVSFTPSEGLLTSVTVASLTSHCLVNVLGFEELPCPGVLGWCDAASTSSLVDPAVRTGMSNHLVIILHPIPKLGLLLYL